MILFEEVLAYIMDYDPEFPDSIEGASEGEIIELEDRTGGKLPEAYKNFLEVMGRSTGWINIQKLDFSIGTVLEYYRRDTALPVDEFFRIGTDTKDPSYNPHLQMSIVAEDLKVVAFPGCTPETFEETTARYMTWLAGSLQEMIARPAFRIFEIFGPDREPRSIRTETNQPGQIDKLEALLIDQYKLEKEFWSSNEVRGYKSDEMVVEAAQLGGRPLELLLRTEDPDQMNLVSRSIAATVDGDVGAPAF
ncbi:MAG: SMI1/KNR4 family protein [Acidobacteriota bacterium]|nr:SMI1/KNR4 family protein [Acidobacteriota bacterium]MDH3527992.1 SMI1/KNR4 family protein [Acidobacteriota bacterium]